MVFKHSINEFFIRDSDKMDVVLGSISSFEVYQIIEHFLSLKLQTIFSQPIENHIFTNGYRSIFMSALSAIMSRIMISRSLPETSMSITNNLNMNMCAFVINLGIIVSITMTFLRTLYKSAHIHIEIVCD